MMKAVTRIKGKLVVMVRRRVITVRKVVIMVIVVTFIGSVGVP